MLRSWVTILLIGSATAARPFLNEPDTGIELVLAANGTLPPLKNVVGLPDFDWIARQHLPSANYTYYRNGAAGEWSYRNNLERCTIDAEYHDSRTKLFCALLHLSMCKGGQGNVEGELGLVKGAADGDILYILAFGSSLPLKELAAARVENSSYTQTLWRQVYLNEKNDTQTKELLAQIEEAGYSAVVFTVDSAAAGVRHRAERFSAGSADLDFNGFTWEYYQKAKSFTKLPVLLKGIMTVDDARLAVENGVPAIILSNHGGRNIDTSPSGLEVAYEIHQEAPEIFKQMDVLADGGVRYGTDVLKLLALGVKAVGLGRPFMYANMYGREGVKHAIDIMKFEIANDAAHLGLMDVHDVTPKSFKWGPNFWYS